MAKSKKWVILNFFEKTIIHTFNGKPYPKKNQKEMAMKVLSRSEMTIHNIFFFL